MKALKYSLQPGTSVIKATKKGLMLAINQY